jgi:hypothetical protein
MTGLHHCLLKALAISADQIVDRLTLERKYRLGHHIRRQVLHLVILNYSTPALEIVRVSNRLRFSYLQ